MRSFFAMATSVTGDGIDWSVPTEGPRSTLSRSRRSAVIAGAIVVVILLTGAGLAYARVAGHPRPIDACGLLTVEQVAQATGVPTRASSFAPEAGHGKAATACSYRGASKTMVTVFGVSPGGREMVSELQQSFRQRNTPTIDIGGPDYLGIKTVYPRFESAVLLRGDRYANVVVDSGPPGAVDGLARLAAAAL